MPELRRRARPPRPDRDRDGKDTGTGKPFDVQAAIQAKPGEAIDGENERLLNRHSVWTALIVILGLAVIGSACGGGDQKEETSSATSVTAAPSTAAPSTAAPTTAAPTTAAPTTAAPTTAAPTTAKTPTIDLRHWIADATARFELIAAAHAQPSSAAAEVPSVTRAACNEVASDAQIQEAAEFLVGAPDDQLANLARAWSETFFDEMDACIASEFELTVELAAEEGPILDEMLERLTQLAVELYLRGGRPSTDGS